MTHARRQSAARLDAAARRGFTLVELLLAITISSFIFGALWMSVGQLTRARSISRERMLAHVRADAALNEIRRDLASVLRSDDLFWAKFRVFDRSVTTPWGVADRDDLLLFSSRLRLTRKLYDQGEGLEYETQYRIEDDAAGPVLWQRRDSMPDEYFDGGGVVTPLVDGIVSFNVEVYDGEQWWPTWDSDDFGLPVAVRLTIAASVGDDPAQRPIVLRTLVAVDRVLPPFDADLDEEELEDEEEGAAAAPTGGGGPQPPTGDDR